MAQHLRQARPVGFSSHARHLTAGSTACRSYAELPRPLEMDQLIRQRTALRGLGAALVKGSPPVLPNCST